MVLLATVSDHYRIVPANGVVPQQAWVQSGTVRDNIAFVNPEKADLARIDGIIDACGLRADVEMWTDGDL